MKAWLKENEIPCCDTMFKVHDLVKTTSIKKYIINRILAQHGRKVLRHPLTISISLGLFGLTSKEWVTSKNTTFNQTALPQSFLNTGAARCVNVCCSIQDTANKYYKREGKTEDTNERTMTAHGVEDRSNTRINDK
jgi:hypothetical protein